MRSVDKAQNSVEEGLLAAISADPDAVEPRLIYADWLQGRGDPRGELIVVQHERRARPGDAELRVRERDLVERATAELLVPPLHRRILDRWELGFVDKLVLNGRDLNVARYSVRGWLGRAPLRAVREVDVSMRKRGGFGYLAARPLGRCLRRLRIGTPALPFEPATAAEIGELAPALRSLTVRGIALPPLDAFGRLPLEEFGFEVADAGSLAQLGSLAKLPATLESLEVFVRRPGPGVIEALRPLLTGQLLPGLRRLALTGVPAVDALEQLAASGRARTLESVTLGTFDLDNAAAARLVPHRDALAKLRILPIRYGQSHSDGISLQHLGALLHYYLGRSEEAVPCYEEAVRLNPRNEGAHHGLGNALQGAKRAEEALQVFDGALRSFKMSASLYYSRRFASSDLRRHAAAAADLERAIALDPEHVDAWNALGVERLYTGDAGGAIAAFERAIELKPDHGYAPRNRAEVLLEQERHGEALPIVQQLADTRPEDAWLALLRGGALLALDRRPEAVAAAGALLARPDRPYHHAALLLRALARRSPPASEDRLAREDLAELIRLTSCPGWIALVWLVEDMLEPGRWARAVPAGAIDPPAISAAIAEHGRAVRPADATPPHAAEPGDHVEAAERAIAGALLGGDRPLALRRMRALHAYLEAEGEPISHSWPHSAAPAFRAIGARLSGEDRELLRIALGAPRGRVLRAELLRCPASASAAG